MKEKIDRRHPALHAMEIPPELFRGEPVITISGSSMVAVENYKCILRYTQEEICLRTSRGIVKICGRELRIPFYTVEEMKIEGRISAILMESR